MTGPTSPTCAKLAGPGGAKPEFCALPTEDAVSARAAGLTVELRRAPGATARLPIPREHGAYLTLLGAATLGVLQAPARAPAVGAALALAAVFFARGPLEARGGARGRGALMLVACAAIGTAGIALAARVSPGAGVLSLAAPIAMLAAASAARRSHRARAIGFVLIAMATLGASAGLVAWIGGAPAARAGLLTAVLCVHAVASVQLLRAELRPRERDRLPARARLGAALVAIVAAALGALSLPAGVALLPRLLVLLTAPRLRERRPAMLGLRETAALALCVAIAALIR
jgi:hypothetical protein